MVKKNFSLDACSMTIMLFNNFPIHSTALQSDFSNEHKGTNYIHIPVFLRHELLRNNYSAGTLNFENH